MKDIGIIVSVIFSVLSLSVSVFLAYKKIVSSLILKLGTYLKKKPTKDNKGNYVYDIRVKNSGFKTIKLDSDEILKLNFQAKVDIIEHEIVPGYPGLVDITAYEEQDEGSSVTRLAIPFGFLNRKDYFDIHLKVKTKGKAAPKLQVEIRKPDMKEMIIPVKYTRLRRTKNFIANSMFYIGCYSPLIVLLSIIILNIIDEQIIKEFAKNPKNVIIAILIFFFSHNLLVILGFKLADEG